MSQPIQYPFWVNWIWWHAIESRRQTDVERRRAVWQFLNELRTIPKESVVIDCGANVGDVTAAFLRRGLRVHAFEPDPIAVKVLHRRFRGNARLTVHQAAIGTEPGIMTLYRKAGFAGQPRRSTISSSLLRRDIHSEADSISVNVISFSEFINSLDVPVRIVKMDIEGAEVDVLEQLLNEGTDKKIGNIYAETHERHSAGLAQRTAELRQRIAEARVKNINLDWR